MNTTALLHCTTARGEREKQRDITARAHLFAGEGKGEPCRQVRQIALSLGQGIALRLRVDMYIALLASCVLRLASCFLLKLQGRGEGTLVYTRSLVFI